MDHIGITVSLKIITVCCLNKLRNYSINNSMRYVGIITFFQDLWGKLMSDLWRPWCIVTDLLHLIKEVLYWETTTDWGLLFIFVTDTHKNKNKNKKQERCVIQSLYISWKLACSYRVYLAKLSPHYVFGTLLCNQTDLSL